MANIDSLSSVEAVKFIKTEFVPSAKNKTLLLQGDSGLGKTYSLGLVSTYLNDKKIGVIFLHGVSTDLGNYYPFQGSALSLKNRMIRDSAALAKGVAEAVIDSPDLPKEIPPTPDHSWPLIQAITKAMFKLVKKIFKNLDDNRTLSSNFSDNEIEILNKIQSSSMLNNTLVILIDNFNAFDSKSKILIKKLIAGTYDAKYSFTKKIKIVMTTNSEEATLKELKVFDIDTKIQLRKMTDDEVSTELSRFNLSQQILNQLIAIIQGNPGKTKLIVNLLESKKINTSTNFISNQDFFAIIDSAIKQIASTLSFNLIEVLSSAAIIGDNFSTSLLAVYKSYTETSLKSWLTEIEKSKLILPDDRNADNESFSGSVIYHYFLEKKKDTELELREKLGLAIEKYRPNEHELAFHNFLIAKNYKLAAEEGLTATVFSLFETGQLNGDISKHIHHFAKKAIDDIDVRNANELLFLMEQSDYKSINANKLISFRTIKDSYLNHLIDYIYAFIVYKNSATSEYKKALKRLDGNISEFQLSWDLKIKSCFLKLLLSTNRIDENIDIRTLLKKVTEIIADASGISDESFSYYGNILDMISGSCLENNLAISKLTNAIKYEESRGNNTSQIKLMTNKSGLLYYSGNYACAFSTAEDAIRIIHDNQLIINNQEKLINNFIISALRAEKKSPQQAADELNAVYEKLDSEATTKKLINHNRIVINFLSGKNKSAKKELYTISEEFKNHNNYYHFIICNNLLCMEIKNQNFEKAQILLDELKEIKPSIMINEQNVIKHRNFYFEQLIEKKSSDINTLIEYFTDNYREGENSSLNQPFILSDIQYWTFF